MDAPRAPARKKWLLLLILVLAGGAVGAFVGFGPPQLYAKSSTPDFCASCHVMESQFENWFHAGAHRNLKCVDCHLPNDNLASHFVWKNYEGMRDMFIYYSGQVPERIQITSAGAEIVQANCRRCHEETVALINEDRQCWSCHRRLSHKTTGTF